jgi:hypothetical protein
MERDRGPRHCRLGSQRSGRFRGWLSDVSWFRKKTGGLGSGGALHGVGVLACWQNGIG